jgi:hypothetical protein
LNRVRLNRVRLNCVRLGVPSAAAAVLGGSDEAQRFWAGIII